MAVTITFEGRNTKVVIKEVMSFVNEHGLVCVDKEEYEALKALKAGHASVEAPKPSAEAPSKTTEVEAKESADIKPITEDLEETVTEEMPQEHVPNIDPVEEDTPEKTEEVETVSPQETMSVKDACVKVSEWIRSDPELSKERNTAFAQFLYGHGFQPGMNPAEWAANADPALVPEILAVIQ